MKLLACLLLSSLFVCSTSLAIAAEVQAVKGVVSGNVQMVGFRAMILKQAITFNLAGTARNNLENKTVEFVLQGDPARIQSALELIAMGTSKSSDVKVEKSPATVDENLKTFTVEGWTSTTRMITKPYDLVFALRSDDTPVSEKKAVKTYHEILVATLDADDLAKLGNQGD